ncbi:MAG: family 10 glycosylhydrolase [Planctomycetes bacterium]|nr:family 10 glycosylhydrolase [Planctomycetota bacterium]
MLPSCLSAEETEEVPSPQREFRAAWVATVANIDWPSQRGLSSAKQQQELIAILDRAVELNLNAIIFQVRPHCDALYASELEPWSEYLTGTMGQPPQPFYDPLEFAVAEAHRRGLELHAWFNPYRALHPGSQGELAATHVSKTKPHIVRKYGKHLWLDPGEPDAVEHNVAVILDVVSRYDVDGIHFDDYFYPYQIKDDKKQLVPFPDDRSWQQAQAAGNTLDRDDWRRQNVDRLIQRLSDEIHQVKPWVKFGISPFGIWRPGHPPQIQGFDAYASLYADAKKWWNQGWVDYLTPQLYWKIESPGQSYPVLMQWWHEQNQKHRHLWIGNYTSRVSIEELGNWPTSEITQQIELTRAHPGATGNVHFSMKALMDDRRGMAKALKDGPYGKPALVPASSWLSDESPGLPTLQLKKTAGKRAVSFVSSDDKAPWLWVVRTFTDDHWKIEVSPGHVNGWAIDADGNSPSPKKIAVSAVSRTGVEGPMATLDLK